MDVIVVSVRLIGDSFGRSKVNPAWNGFAGLVIEDGGVDPVAAPVHEFDAEAWSRFEGFLFFKLAPIYRAEQFARLFEGDGCRGDRSDLNIRGAGVRILLLAPTSIRVGKE